MSSTFDSNPTLRPLDDTDWQILHELQNNARITFAELGRRVNMSAPSVAERVLRMEEAGVISGYHAHVNPEKLGYVIRACIRIATDDSSNEGYVRGIVGIMPEVLECHIITGVDSYDLRVIVSSPAHLQLVINELSRIGRCTSSLILATLVPWNEVTRPQGGAGL